MVNAMVTAQAPELDVTEWIGTPSPLSALRGRVVMIEAFQMLCPGCVTSGLPQAQRVQRAFPEVAVIGIHTVIEHHEVMTPAALAVFLSEYRIDFPVGIDRPGEGPVPRTMQGYALRGTPSTLLIDRSGALRFTHLGTVDDVALGAMLGQLLAEPAPAGAMPPAGSHDVGASASASVCDLDGVCS